jgi:hypothetical protein
MGRRGWILVAALGGLLIGGTAAACGSSPSAPTTPPPVHSGPPHSAVVLKGRVVGTVTGEPIAGATVTVGGERLVTDHDGAFSIRNTGGDVQEISISGGGVVPRVSRLSVSDRDVTIDVIQNRPPFELAFFRELGRNALESETGLEPLRPIATAPRIHIRTVDEAGQPMDAALLDLVEAALREAAPLWSADRHPIEVIERGPDTRQGQSGWVTVLFPAEVVAGGCGRATLGSTTGRIELNYRNTSCACSGNVIAPRTVRHELGHVYGYWHTAVRGGVMSRSWTTRQCNGQPSPRETEHAKYMYSRALGNVDPDTDAAGRVLRAPWEIVIED